MNILDNTRTLDRVPVSREPFPFDLANRPCYHATMRSFMIPLAILTATALQAKDIPDPELVRQAVTSPDTVPTRDYTHLPQQDRDERMQWWRDARFGVFIHIGPYAVMGGEYKGKVPHPCAEWIMNFGKVPAAEYRKNAAQFTLDKFDADAWVQAIKAAGAKYIVVTTKHHDGFCMFDSALTDYNVKKATPYGKDFLKELSDACRKHGVVFGTYYSVLEWDNPALGFIPAQNKKGYLPYMKGQLAELIGKYGTEILWFDGEWENWWTDPDGREIYNYLRTLKPDLIVNNRITKARQGMEGMNKEGMFGADFGTPEQEIPDTGLPGKDWESCMTMNKSWGYAKNDHQWKSAQTLIKHLIDTASKGGNYLLNIGPMANGEIPQASLERLAEIGRWMDKNHEAVYGTTLSAFGTLPWGRSTTKGDTSYLFVYDWPADGKLLIPFSPAGELSLKALNGGNAIPYERTPGGIVADIGNIVRDPHATVLAMAGKGTVIDGIAPQTDGSFILNANTARLTGGAKLETPPTQGKLVGASEKAEQNIGFWMKQSDTVSWKINNAKPGSYKVEINYACSPDSGGTPVAVTAGSASYPWTVAPTSSWQDYRTDASGIIRLEKGDNTLTFQATAKPKIGVANIRNVRLIPVPSH